MSFIAAAELPIDPCAVSAIRGRHSLQNIGEKEQEDNRKGLGRYRPQPEPRSGDRLIARGVNRGTWIRFSGKPREGREVVIECRGRVAPAGAQPLRAIEFPWLTPWALNRSPFPGLGEESSRPTKVSVVSSTKTQRKMNLFLDVQRSEGLASRSRQRPTGRLRVFVPSW